MALLMAALSAAAPAPLQPDPHMSSLVAAMATGGRLLTQHTCRSDMNVPEICPGLERDSGRSWQLGVPERARWLFYGPSYMGEIFETLVAANQVMGVESLENASLVSDILRGSSIPADELASEHGDAACDLPQGAQAQCNVASAQRYCRVQAGYGIKRVTLNNGAVLVGIHNNALLQTEANTEVLAHVLSNLQIEHAFYMQPHNFTGSKYHGPRALCTEQLVPRQTGGDQLDGVDELQQRRTSGFDGDMCLGQGFRVDKAAHLACARSSATWQAVRKHSKRSTLVASWAVVPDGEQQSDENSSVYFTRDVIEQSRCACSNFRDDLGGVAWDDTAWAAKHQCILLQDGTGAYFGGPIMRIAEELMDRALSSQI